MAQRLTPIFTLAALLCAPQPAEAAEGKTCLVQNGRPVGVRYDGAEWQQGGGFPGEDTVEP